MTGPDRERLDALWDRLGDEDEYSGEDFSSHRFNQRSISALGSAIEGRLAAAWATSGDAVGETRARVRLHGPAVRQHALSVRLAMKALVGLQDIISALAMAGRGKTSLFGAIPGDIRALTELELFPRPAFGSVVFELAGPAGQDTSMQIPGLADGRNEADRAAGTLAAVLGEAGREDETPEELLRDLRALGPRVATQLRRLSNLPLEDGVFLDIEWQQATGTMVSGRFGATEAAVLRRIITESRVSVERQTIGGILVTLSTEDPLALRLHDGGRIPMALGEGLDADSLAPFFNAPVQVVVDVEIQTQPTTGRDIRKYTLIDVFPTIGPDDAEPEVAS